MHKKIVARNIASRELKMYSVGNSLTSLNFSDCVNAIDGEETLENTKKK